MRLTITTFLTLDGVIQAPGAPDEDTQGGFPHGGWQVPYVDDDNVRLINSWFENADAFLLGRRTYDIFASYWPRVTDEHEHNLVARKLNTLPKYVASSSTVDTSVWQHSVALTGDVPQQVAELKQQPGNELQIHGSGRLAQSLMAHGLIDEYRLLTYPIVLGSGQRLFDDASAAALQLVDLTRTGSGAVVAIYQPSGRPAYGSFALDA